MKATRILLFCGMATVASATSVTFNFNSLAENNNASAIASYMISVLTAAGCTGCSVTVTGAVADTAYDGENHVTGPGTPPLYGHIPTSLTLGTSDGATASTTTSHLNGSYDTFLATTNDASSQVSTQITMKFSGFTINGSASFDYEIFPDGSCPSASNCTSTPDFKFDVNGSSPVNSFGTNGVQYGVTPGTTNGNSDNSQLSNSEASLQYIGTWSGSLSNVSELDFIDWPATIGVDNLSISWNTSTQQSPVPEPFSIVLLGTIVGGIALRKKVRKSVA